MRRRSQRGQLEQGADLDDVDHLVRVYRDAGRTDAERRIRIDALIAIAKADPAAAEPLLREVIDGPDDPWVAIAAMDTARRAKMTGLLDAIGAARDDPRPAVATAAKQLYAKLSRTQRRGKGRAAP